MAARYHLSAGGDPKPCSAHKRPCPLGFSPEEHYSSPGEAQAAYEKSQEASLLRKFRRSPLRRFTLAGSALLATVSLSACGDLSTPTVPSPAGPTPTSAEQVIEGVLKGGSEGARKKAEEVFGDQEATVRKAQEAGGKATDYAKAHQGEVRATAAKAVGAGKEALEQVLNANPPAAPQASAGQVTFQGKPLTVTAAEREDALAKLRSIPLRKSRDSVAYNRERDYGPFKEGVVGRLEHRDVPTATFKSSSKKSRAVEGSYVDPYTGRKASIVPGAKTDSDVDHVVALSEASKSGTDEWLGVSGSPQQRAEAAAFREALANDPDNLVLVASAVNRGKGDADVAVHGPGDSTDGASMKRDDSYLPSYEPSQCRYAMAVVRVKAKNKQFLSVDAAEYNVLSQVLQEKCSVTG